MWWLMILPFLFFSFTTSHLPFHSPLPACLSLSLSLSLTHTHTHTHTHTQMYYMFDNLLLLAKGKVAYFGPVKEAMTYFANLGLRCDLQYNPADYMSE